MNISVPSWLTRITGARQGELQVVLASFFSLLFLQSSYYLVKPLRNSQFLKEFPPEYLPIVYLVISLLSFVITKAYSSLYGRFDRNRILIGTFAVICLFKGFFTWALQDAGRPLTVAFYLWGSVYFLLALSAIWGCINDIFRAEQSERCFGFVATGSTLGCILGSALATKLSSFGPHVLWLAIAFMLMSLGAILQARRFDLRIPLQPGQDFPGPAGPLGAEQSTPAEETVTPVVEQASRRGILSELSLLWGNRYLWSLATMVTCLAIYTTGVDFTSQQQMDRSMSIRAYQHHLAQFGPAPDSPAYKFVRSLRGVGKTERESKIQEFSAAEHMTLQQSLELGEGYNRYKDEMSEQTQRFFSSTNLLQGLCGAFVLTFICPLVFQRFGMSVATMIFPVFALVGLAVFTVPLSVEMIQFLLVVGGTLNYNLNNATKEVLYTVTTTEEKHRIKPMIEGPCMRLGDMVASIAKLLLGLVVLQVPLLGTYRDEVYLLFCGLCVCLWMRAMWWAASEYQNRKHSTVTT